MTVAFPFVQVTIDTKDLVPTARRAPGVLAVVGRSDQGSAVAGEPTEVGSVADAATKFGDATALGRSLRAALAQDPGPSTLYGVKVDGDKWQEALAGLGGADDVTVVCLAEVFIKAAAGGGAANPELVLLKAHVEGISKAGNKCIGIAAIDPTLPRTDKYASDVLGFADNLKGDAARMVVVAARGAVYDTGATADPAAAAAAAIAGLPVEASIVLKMVSGFHMPLAAQYGPIEISDLAKGGIVPVIDPALIPGESLHFAEGTAFTGNKALGYIDIVRLLDAIDFDLKARLIGLVGDAGITRSGLRFVLQRVIGVLEGYQGRGAIDGFRLQLPVLDALELPEAARSAAQKQLITDSRESREVALGIVVVLGPAVHRLSVTLKVSFV